MLGSLIKDVGVSVGFNLIIIFVVSLDAFLDIGETITLLDEVTLSLLRPFRVRLPAERTHNLLVSGVHNVDV